VVKKTERKHAMAADLMTRSFGVLQNTSLIKAIKEKSSCTASRDLTMKKLDISV